MNLDQIFVQDAIMTYPSFQPKDLTHEYSDERTNSQGQPIPFEETSQLLKELRQDVEKWYQEKFQEPIDTFNLGDRAQEVKQKFYQDPRFKQSFENLELDYQDHQKIKIPWWNEIAAGETNHQFSEQGAHLKLGPRHSYETQLMREGLRLPIQNVSIGSLIITRDNHLTIGLRGGASYPNTYHINAGALKATPDFKTGNSTLYDVFKEHELTPEFALTEQDLESAKPLSRINDRVIDQGPMYIFSLRTNLDSTQIHEKWSANLDPDKAEHNSLVFLPANPEAINQFIRENYQGQVKNRPRGDHERFLLHPGALALASFSGISPLELRGLWQDKIH